VKQDGHSSETITHVSLCSGYEGIGLGLRRVLPNLREIAYVEREGFPVANLVAKMEEGELDAAPVFTDVKSFPYRKFRGLVDILSGGFPCQPFSTAGKREGVEDPRHLFPFIRDGIRECQPRIVFLENVEGIISAKTADGESVLKYVLRELEGLGYRATAGVFSAAEVGAPHQRKRVFILGMADSNNGLGNRSELEICTRGDAVIVSSAELADSEGHRHGGRIRSGSSRVEERISKRQKEGEREDEIWGETKRCSGELRSQEELADAQSNRSARKAGTICEETGQVGELPRELGESGHRSEELADSSSKRLQGQLFTGGVNSQRRKKSDGCTSPSCRIRQNELADTNSSRGRKDREQPQLRAEGSVESPSNRWPSRSEKAREERSQARNGGQDTSGGSAELANSNNEGLEGYERHNSSEQSKPIKANAWSACGTPWPSRPGEPQQEWEEPRVVLNPTSEGQAEPSLGRASHGSSSRVDRLRLLGNGVVPDTAAKAFATLLQSL